MAPPSQHLLLFGDQTVEKLTSVQALVRNSKASRAAKRFLQEATDITQLEFAKVDRQKHGWEGNFDSLLGLAEENNSIDGSANGMVATVLMCIGRLGALICAAEKDSTILGSKEQPVQVLGFCTGLIPAAAVIAAKDSNDLFYLARELISITFRMAYEIRCQMKLVEDVSGSWANTYIGLEQERVQDILNQFHESENIPVPRRIAIGVVSKGWLTLVGAPSSLNRLSSWSTDISKAGFVKTDSGGPIHTTYMTPIDIEAILGESKIRNMPLDWSKAKMFSPASCKAYQHSTLGSLLREIIQDIAHNVLYLGKTIEALVPHLRSDCGVQITVMGPTGHLTAVEQALKSQDISYHISSHSNPLYSENARGGSEMVAIVGMAGRFPGSETVDGLWDDLVAGKCHIKKVPKSRFDLDVFYDPTGEKRNSTTAQHGAWIDEPGLFDHRLFNVSPREAAQMDPIQRLLLATSYEALETAGYSPDATLSTGKSRIATYFGQTSDDWHEILNNEGVDIYYVPSLARAFAPSRLNYQYKWAGGSFAIDSACATSTTAVSLACSALISRECDMALAGGGSVLVSPNAFSGLSKSGMISSTGGCRTYHEDADGYARGEAVAVVILKRLEDAMADNDNILGIVRGSTRTYSSTSTSITHPSHTSQEQTYNSVLRQSSLDPEEISYVEMHGTGTQAGDYEEMTSIINVLARNRNKDNPLTVGAIKAAVGHGEAAAGVTSLIKVLMMLRNRMIPPQPGWPFKLNPNFPRLDKLNVKISTAMSELRPSPKGDHIRKVLLNSFDASGGNTSLIIQEPPSQPAKSNDPRTTHVVVISSRTPRSLSMNRQRLLDYLTHHPETKVADLAYTTTARRMHEVLRVAYVGKSTRDIVRQLKDDAACNGTNDPKTKVTKTNRVFLFTGQGSQYAGMGRDLFHSDKSFSALLQAYENMAAGMGLPRFLSLISDADLDIEAQPTTRIQLAIVSLGMALTSTLRTLGVMPDAVIGHSLGEYAALNAANVLSASDVLYLVGRRAMLMEEHLTPGTHAMFATNSDAATIRQSLVTFGNGTCGIACINTPSATVVSGPTQEVERFHLHLKNDDSRAKGRLLKVPYGFHSAQLDPILDNLLEISKGAVFRKPTVPIFSSLTGSIETDFSAEYMVRQARQPVNFAGALSSCEVAGYMGENAVLIEIGPGPVCSALARQTLSLPPSSRVLPILKPDEDNWSTLSAVLKAGYETGVSVNWPEYHKHFKNSVRLLDLPHYAFDNKNFWTSYNEYVPKVPESKPRTIESPGLTRFLTTSLQRVDSEEVTDEQVRVTFSSDISEPVLLKAVTGHVVAGQQVCPLGVFCDMAMTAAYYAYFKAHHKEAKTETMTIHEIQLDRALVITKGAKKPVARVSSVYKPDTKTVAITFGSHHEGQDVTHGTCTVRFSSMETWRDSFAHATFLTRSRIETLEQQKGTGKVHDLLKPVIYKLFSGVVEYSEAYRGLQSVILERECRDAVGRVKLASASDLGDYLFDPYAVDSITHLAGFVLNGGLRFSDDIACISLGFDFSRTLEHLSREKTYTSYVCMQDVAGGHMISGDCYVFEGDKLVHVTSGIKFQKLKKVVLNTILGVDSQEATHHILKSKNDAKQDAVKAAPSPSRGVDNHTSNPSPGMILSNGNTVSDFERNEQISATSSSISDNSARSSASHIVETLLRIVSDESGCSREEMTDEAEFSTLGVDSLMAITIFSIIKRETELDLEAAFFFENPTVGKARDALLKRIGENDFREGTSDKASSESSFVEVDEVPSVTQPCPPGQELLPVQAALQPSQVTVTHPAVQDQGLTCRVVDLQGSRTGDADLLFLLADETGSALAYLQLPELGDNLCVVGVSSPFVKSQSAFDISIEQLAAAYASTIRKEQSQGAYMLGGISGGAAIAYETAKCLLQTGGEIRGLILLDPLEGTPRGRGSTPTQKENIKRTVTALEKYKATPFVGNMPAKVIVVGPKYGAENRNKWENLAPGTEYHEVDGMSGALMKSPALGAFGTKCKEVIAIIRK